jgi:hypothetical protein
MSDIVKIIKGLHVLMHDVLRVVTTNKTTQEMIPLYEPKLREGIKDLKNSISDKAVLILVDYMEHMIDAGTKNGFCDMANLLESMINVYMESDEPVKIDEEPHEQETKAVSPEKNHKDKKTVYRIMNKRHKIKRYKAGCIYDIILEYLIKNLPVNFMRSDVQATLREYYRKADLRVPIDSSLNTYAGLYIRCGREVIPPVFKRTGQIGKGRGQGRGNAEYRKTGEKLKIENVEFDEVTACKRWDGWEDKLIIDNYKKMSYRKIQEKHLPHRTLIAIEKHATSTLHLKKPYALKIEDEPVKKEKDTEGGFNIRVVDKFAQRKKEDPTPKIEKAIEPKEKPEEEVKETEPEEPVEPKEEPKEEKSEDEIKEIEPEENIKTKSDEIIEPVPTGESPFSLNIKRKKTEDDIVDFKSLSFPDQIYMYAEKVGWIGLKRDISFLIIKKHFPGKTIDEIEDAILELISDERVDQTGSGRVNFKRKKEVIK